MLTRSGASGHGSCFLLLPWMLLFRRAQKWHDTQKEVAGRRVVEVDSFEPRRRPVSSARHVQEGAVPREFTLRSLTNPS